MDKNLKFPEVSVCDIIPDGVNHGVEVDEGELMLDALGGFLIFVSRAGKIIYIHHQVANILGVQQVGEDSSGFKM